MIFRRRRASARERDGEKNRLYFIRCGGFFFFLYGRRVFGGFIDRHKWIHFLLPNIRVREIKEHQYRVLLQTILLLLLLHASAVYC